MRRLASIALVSSIVGCGSSGGAGHEDFVPVTPFAYDGKYLEGSFEEVQGFGWDTCFTRTAGLFAKRTTGDAPNGDWYAILESGGCAGTCASSNLSTSQLYLWFTQPPTAMGAMGLYFDVLNLDAPNPTGTLLIYGTNSGCMEESPLGEAPLDGLQPSSTWSTRCLTISAPGAHDAIGVAMSGAPHKIGLDALRLGPPCH
jgi:hypothetical protein